MNHLLRAHPPEITHEGALLFDDAMAARLTQVADTAQTRICLAQSPTGAADPLR